MWILGLKGLTNKWPMYALGSSWFLEPLMYLVTANRLVL